jgi:hypothetical protein
MHAGSSADAREHSRQTAMAIGNVIQKGSWLQIYDVKCRPTLTMIYAGPECSLTCYSSSTVNAKKGPWIMTYDETRRQIAFVSER